MLYKSDLDKEGMQYDEPILVSVDLGNAVLKISILHSKDHSVTYNFSIPHGVVNLAESQWISLQQRSNAAMRQVDYETQSFKIRPHKNKKKDYGSDWNNHAHWNAFQVGKAAFRSLNNVALRGASRYTENYLSSVFFAAMLQALPPDEYNSEKKGRGQKWGHNNIILACNVPPTDNNYGEKVRDILAAPHKGVLPDGREVVYAVSYAVHYDEGIAAVWNWQTENSNIPRNERGQFADKVLTNGDQILYLEMGGYQGAIVSITYLEDGREINLSPEYDTVKAIQGGILNVYSDLETAINLRYKSAKGYEALADIGHLSHGDLDEIIKTGGLRLSCGFLEMYDAVADSFQVMNNALRTWRNNFGSGLRHKVQIVGGGTSVALSRVMLKDKDNNPRPVDIMKSMFPHNNWKRVASEKMVMYATAKGGLLVLLSKLKEENRVPKEYQKVI